MNEVITYRISTKETWQYEFYQNGERFGHASFNITPSKPAQMEGPNLKWNSPFDLDSEIIPITNRIVMSNETGKEKDEADLYHHRTDLYREYHPVPDKQTVALVRREYLVLRAGSRDERQHEHHYAGEYLPGDAGTRFLGEEHTAEFYDSPGAVPRRFSGGSGV